MLMEVMVSIALIGMLLTPVLVLQQSVIKRIAFNKKASSSLFDSDVFFYQHIFENFGISGINKSFKVTNKKELFRPERFKDLFFTVYTNSQTDKKETFYLPTLVFIPDKNESNDNAIKKGGV